MKSDYLIIVEELIESAGAVGLCPACHSEEVRVGGEGAARKAYGIATERWKDGSFGREDRDSIMRLVKGALDDIPIECRTCASP